MNDHQQVPDEVLINDWETSTKIFHAFLSQILGINEYDPGLYEFIVRNIESQERLDQWIEQFDGSLNPEDIAATTYRWSTLCA